MLCVFCDKPLDAATQRGITDCAHEFCLKCVCRQLTDRRNLCPICGSKVKTVHQIHGDGDPEKATAPEPASIRFNNAVYVLNVSIWDVDDPARVLADLFHLQQARLIHKGKMLKKGDVWPGTVVQLFGTRVGSSNNSGSVAAWTPSFVLNWALVDRIRSIVCCPVAVVYEFFRSIFVVGDRERRGYQRVEQVAADHQQPRQAPSSFNAPGRVSTPSLIDSAD